MNEAQTGASHAQMPRPDSDLTPDQLAELVALDGAGLGIKAALSDSLNLVDGVMDALDAEQIDLSPLHQQVDLADAVFAALSLPSVDLSALTGSVDLGDAVFADIENADAMELAAYADGEIEGEGRARLARKTLVDSEAQYQVAAQAQLGSQLQAALSGHVDVWEGVATAIGAEHAPDLGAQLRTVFSEVTAIDVSAEVMARVTPKVWRATRWVAAGVPIGILVAAALLLLTVIPSMPMSNTSVAALAPAFVMGADNHAQVESIETPASVTAQVIQFEEAGPTFIVVDEGEVL